MFSVAVYELCRQSVQRCQSTLVPSSDFICSPLPILHTSAQERISLHAGLPAPVATPCLTVPLLAIAKLPTANSSASRLWRVFDDS